LSATGGSRAVLLGRDDELRRLGQLLGGARDGFGGAVLVLGEPGVGKTALLGAAGELAGDMRVLQVRGAQAEVDLAFSGLADLVRPLEAELPGLAPPQAAVLASAVALGPHVQAGLFAVAVAANALMEAVSREHPVLALVDDAQWLDWQSQRVLVYVARRAHLLPMAVAVAARDDDEAALLRGAGLPEMMLGGLTAQDAEHVLAAVAPEIRAPVRQQLIAGAHGNPLALIEIAGSLDAAQREGARPLPEPLPTGRTVEQAYLRRVRSLPDHAQSILLLAAASDSEDMDEILGAARHLGLDPAGLGVAEQRMLIVVDGRRVVFRHPLIRSAVYHSADTPARHAAHQALAASVQGPFADDRRAWHAAAGADTRDEAVAAALEEAARRVRQRSGPGTALEPFQRAAELTPEADRRAARLLEAAIDAQMAGRFAEGDQLAQQGLSLTEDVALVADLELTRARCMLWRRPMSETGQLLLDAADRVERVEPARAAMLLADAATAQALGADVFVAVDAARRAHAIAKQLGPPLEHLTAARLGGILAVRGDEAGARPLLDEWVAGVDWSNLLWEANDAAFNALAFLWFDEHELARRLLDGLIGQGRGLNAIGVLPLALAVRAELEFRTGRWHQAEIDANEAITIGLDFGQGTLLTYCWYQLVVLDAGRGNEVECLERAAHLRSAVEQSGVRSITMYVDAALGFLYLGLGQLDKALDHLETAERDLADCGAGEVAIAMSLPDLIETYGRSGRRRDAEGGLARLDEAAESTGRASLEACAARCHGLLATGQYQQHFEGALDLHARLPNTFERARTEMCYGERLRRAGRPLEARPLLHAALDTFESLGATGWARHVVAEIEATGERRQVRDGPVSTELTARELQVARLVTAGASNREIAATLFLSTKTVEHHLSSAYRKVGVRSRTQLARVVSQQQSVV
jgi:DNA-binding CsgD family transcriptional regulator/tetratricopeptide (TPR) repeat protein